MQEPGTNRNVIHPRQQQVNASATITEYPKAQEKYNKRMKIPISTGKIPNSENPQIAHQSLGARSKHNPGIIVGSQTSKDKTKIIPSYV